MRKAINYHRENDGKRDNEVIQWICSQFGGYDPVTFYTPDKVPTWCFPSLPRGAIFEVLEDLECPGLQDCATNEAFLKKGQTFEVITRMHEHNGYVMRLRNTKSDSRLRIIFQQFTWIDWRGVKATYKPRTAREMVLKSLELNEDLDHNSPVKMADTALLHWIRAVQHFKLPYLLYSDYPEAINFNKEDGELVNAIKFPSELRETVAQRLAETLFTQHSRDKWYPRFFIESESFDYILVDIAIKAGKGIIRAYFVPAGAIIL